MQQPDLWSVPAPIAVPVPAPAKARLSRQCAAILARLQQGPATNRELCELALKYTSRISDLRAAGYRIAVSEDKASGRAVYRLEVTE